MWNTIEERRRIGRPIKNCARVTRIIEGKIKGEAGRGRTRTPFIKRTIVHHIGKTNYKGIKVSAMDKKEWAAIVYDNSTNIRIVKNNKFN